ncbi:MAG: Hsp20/alpha crystallin family protein [Phycisphaerae bacterium]|jgi:HSP20 family protein|nr:Hsp20/alpha crystallin family protein [Phycisphaerae bacterium]MCZ2399522.1 Hsp20/alpha crystallin family protein [Phycisphaerae bacterium]NUQ49636.1 Hsp20/alpha crystallin family protein [Phycisphaerae bacterium]
MFRTIDWYTPFQQLRREMQDLIDTVAPEFAPAAVRPYPAVNIYSAGDALLVEAEVPGVRREDLEILTTGNELTIKGRRPGDDENLTFHRRERGVGEFTRVVTLPIDVDADKIEATLQDGVLTLRLPKAESARPRQITVKAG